MFAHVSDGKTKISRFYFSNFKYFFFFFASVFSAVQYHYHSEYLIDQNLDDCSSQTNKKKERKQCIR